MSRQRGGLSWEEFCSVVRQVLDTLPPELRPYLQNVVVDVEQEPSPEALRAVGLTEQEIAAGVTIYGMFEPMFAGMYTEALDFHAMPHRIVIYKGPLERDFPDPKQLRIEIRKTVIHELAHHFGWTDRDLERFDENPNPFGDDEPHPGPARPGLPRGPGV